MGARYVGEDGEWLDHESCLRPRDLAWGNLNLIIPYS